MGDKYAHLHQRGKKTANKKKKKKKKRGGKNEKISDQNI